MKTKLSLIASLLFTASVSMVSAASYTLQTGATATSTGFANSAGLVFQNSASASFAGPGIVGFGIFTISDAAITGAADAGVLTSSFVGFGTSPTGTFTSAGLSANAGTFSRNSTGVIAGSQFSNSLIYLFVGNGTTYANSTEFGVFKTTFSFLAADDLIPTPIVNTVTGANTSVLFGSVAADVKTTGADTTTTPGFRTAAFNVVPEPSSALLGAVGALALLRRRRN